jgi:hypothetical protein
MTDTIALIQMLRTEMSRTTLKRQLKPAPIVIVCCISQ